jgi:hypothetical protein
MPIEVTDVRSSPHDQIAHAARVIGLSPDRRKVFLAIYKGKKKIKTVTEVVKLTSLPRIRVLQEAGKLCDNKIVQKTKIEKELAYDKDPFFSQNKIKILSLAGHKEKLDKFPTKISPRIKSLSVTTISLPKKIINIKQLTIDDIDSFAKVLELKQVPYQTTPLDETKFKQGLQKILGERGVFQDWGGESDDLFSTRLIIKGERKSVAFGLKGKGTNGILTPKKMGKRGDQIQRLFRTPADIFLIQYWNQIDESIIEQMKQFAIAKSALENRRIYYGVIDGQDTLRILASYNYCFS